MLALRGLCEQHDVPVTWAFVGHLFLGSCSRRDGRAHPEIPLPRPDWFDLDPCTSYEEDPSWYAPDLVEAICRSRPGHEFGSHSFSHVDFSRCSAEVARAELLACLDAMGRCNLRPKSFVFPYDRVGHLNLLREHGFLAIRGPKPSPFANALEVAAARLLPLRVTRLLLWQKTGRHPSAVQTSVQGGLVNIPASLLFESRLGWSAQDLLAASLRGLNSAIKAGRIFHVWTHDYSFAAPDLARAFDILLSHVRSERKRGHLETVTLRHLAEASPDRIVSQPAHDWPSDER